MNRSQVSFFHLKYLVCDQSVLYMDLVTRRLIREAGSAQLANRTFVLPVVLELERDWSDGTIPEPSLLKGARRLQQVAEELASQATPAFTERRSVIVGTFGSIYGAGYSLLKTLLLCRDYDVIDLGTNLETQDFLAASVQSFAPDLYITVFAAEELRKIPELVKAYENYGISRPRIVVGGAAVRQSGRQLTLPSSIKVCDSLKGLLSNADGCEYEQV